jgi:hypothetical protein
MGPLVHARTRDHPGLARDREELAAGFGATGYWTAGDPPPGSYDAVIDCTDDHRMPAAALARVEPAGAADREE